MIKLISQFRNLNGDDQVYLGYSLFYSLFLLAAILSIIFFNPYKLLRESEQPKEEVLSTAVVDDQYIEPLPIPEPADPVITEQIPAIPYPEKLDEEISFIYKEIDCSDPEEIKRIDTNEKIVVFTFDADGHDYSMPAILEAFKKRGLKTTFFMEGRWAKVNKEYVERIHRDGHEIFNHSLTHVNFKTTTPAGIKNELNGADEVISSITGLSTKPFFRPPYGGRNDEVRKAACEAGYQSVVWNLDAFDWKESRGISAAQVRANILNNAGPGTIILMHTGNNHTARVLDEAMSVLEQRGYRIMSLTDALTYAQNSAE